MLSPRIGVNEVSTSITVNEYFKRYQLLNPRMRSSKSINAMAIDIKILNDFFREVHPDANRSVEIGDLSADLISGGAGWLVKRGRQPATANRFIRHVSALWRFAAEDESVHHIIKPLKKLVKHKEPKRIPEAWSPDEFARLITESAQIPGQVGRVSAGLWWPCLLLTAYWTGARISAIMHLPTECVDLNRGEIRFPAETQKQYADQSFDLPVDVVEMLRKLNPASRGLSTFFGDWPYDRGGAQWRILGNHFSRILTAAGLKTGRRYKFHCIRRTFATQITAAEGINVAQMMLGHSSVSTTARYIDPRFIKRPKASSILPAMPVPSQLKIVG